MKMIGFDFDGVFMNIEDQKAELFGKVLHKFWGTDPERACKVWINELGTSRRYKFDCLYSERFDRPLSDAEYREVEQYFSNILMREYYPNAQVIAETYDTAKNLNGNFDFAFISSGVSMGELEKITKKISLDQYFDKIYGTNGIYTSKQDHFKEIIQNGKPNLGIFIGDGLEDMRIAKKFNFFAIGLPSNHSPKKLLSAGADLICNFSELQNCIRSLVEEQS